MMRPERGGESEEISPAYLTRITQKPGRVAECDLRRSPVGQTTDCGC
jgi:hypothetical protein